MAGLKDTLATLARMRSQSPIGFVTNDTGVLTTIGAFGKNPGALTMKTYTPLDLAAGRPLVVVLHGCTQTAEAYAVGAGWVDLADRYGFALLCPEQMMTNNANRCFNWFNPEDAARSGGEAASIRAMVEKAIIQASSDRSQVYVTGLSAGGGMAAAMLATYPEVFAGGGIIAGLPYGVARDMPSAFSVMMQGPTLSGPELGRRARAASRHAGPWPRVSVWHGTADATVRASNADASTSQWLELNGIAGDADQSTMDGGNRRDQWLKSGEVVVERRLIGGLGHGTPIASVGPDGAGHPGPFMLEAGLSSSLELLRFWGVVDDKTHAAARPQKQTTSPAYDAKVRRPAALQSGPGEVGVSAVINKALRSAGLMK